ncbi:MAG: hypothetical protein WC315_01065 [Candidatus Omnitrophota bacterium]|jgi:chromosome segregation ATPase
MKKSLVRIGLIILGLLLISLSIWLAIRLNEVQTELNIERQLSASLQKELAATRIKLDRVKVELDNTRKQLNEVNKRSAVTQGDSIKLSMEKKTLKAKLDSLKELKAAIERVKREILQQKQQELLARKEAQREKNVRKLAEGNRGFVLKDSKSTYKPTVKIEVRPGC